MRDSITETLTERFLRYVAVTSQSDVSTGVVPSTKGQLKLAELLASELTKLGVKDTHIDENGNLTGLFPGNLEGADTIGFCAHLDTVDVALKPDIKPQILRYEGGDLLLNKDEDIWLKPSNNPEIEQYTGEEIIFSDGTSVLGADNKAAIAVIMTSLQKLREEGAAHGDIYIAFVPDEEIGLVGSKLLDLKRFPVDYAYTIDCCELGEVVYETFNAATVKYHIEGVTAHPMSAYGVLVNPLLVGKDLMDQFPLEETPENTKDREGYWWFVDCVATQADCNLVMHIRDHNKTKFEARKAKAVEAAQSMQDKYPTAKVSVEVTDVYGNISNSVQKDHKSIAQIYEAFKACEIEPKTIAMRGGTDGSALAERGLIVPNYFTGAHNFHSRFEFLPMSSFKKSYDVTRKIIELASANRA